MLYFLIFDRFKNSLSTIYSARATITRPVTATSETESLVKDLKRRTNLRNLRIKNVAAVIYLIQIFPKQMTFILLSINLH